MLALPEWKSSENNLLKSRANIKLDFEQTVPYFTKWVKGGNTVIKLQRADSDNKHFIFLLTIKFIIQDQPLRHEMDRTRF